MRVLIDTNVMLDVLMGRQPYFDLADHIIKLCADKKMEGYMAAHSVPNMFYQSGCLLIIF
ncbi:MAG: PIN domain-containing protein [Lachnospiraceae bacterium]|nr:PIN domain-containing protein [Lachnospiraceae bacterium]